MLVFRYIGGDKVGKNAMQGTMDEILSEIIKMNGGWEAVLALHYYLEVDGSRAYIEVVKKRGRVWYEYEVVRNGGV